MGYLHEEPEPVVEAQLRVLTGAGDTRSWAVRHAVDAVSAGICAETFAPDADAECTASHVSADCSTFTSVQRDRLHRARLASSARRGFTCRSTYNANCFLRNKFSAASRACGEGRELHDIDGDPQDGSDDTAEPGLDHVSGGYAITAVQRPNPSRHPRIGIRLVPHIRRDFTRTAVTQIPLRFQSTD